MASSKLFSKVPVAVQNRSGFDCSHENLFTTKCGTLTPVLCDLLLPNTTVSLGVSTQIQLPPMATDFYGRIQGKFDLFFVPCRLLYGGFQELITHDPVASSYPSGTAPSQKATYLPYFLLPVNTYGAGSLSDYLDMFVSQSSIGSNAVRVKNPLPFICYHKVWDDWYRDSRIQRSCFSRLSGGYHYAQNIPYWSDDSSSPTNISYLALADGSYLYSLRQRNWSRDYLTNATTSPQAGDPMYVGFNTIGSQNFEDNLYDALTDSDPDEYDVSGKIIGSAAFSISALRAANSLQRWLETNNLAGSRYGDQMKAHFGVYPADATTDRAIHLGSWSLDVYNKSVFQTTLGSTSDTSTRNPFKSVGAKYSAPVGADQGSLVQKFTTSEFGYLMCIFSLCPTAYYDGGANKQFNISKGTDFPFPEFQGVGDEEIMDWEYDSDALNITPEGGLGTTFGYTQRYSSFKFKENRVHGLFHYGENLQHFALQRYIAGGSTLGSSFLEIPTTFLDDVTAVSSAGSNYGCWVDTYFKYHKVQPLCAYSIPTLGDPKDVHTEVIPLGGKRL